MPEYVSTDTIKIVEKIDFITIISHSIALKTKCKRSWKPSWSLQLTLYTGRFLYISTNEYVPAMFVSYHAVTVEVTLMVISDAEFVMPGEVDMVNVAVD